MELIFDNLELEDAATYYNHVVYRLPPDINLEECTHLLESYDGGEQLDEISIGFIEPQQRKNAVTKLHFVRKKYIHYDSFILDDDMARGVIINHETKFTDTNPMT
jgi:hypothetical protein